MNSPTCSRRTSNPQATTKRWQRNRNQAIHPVTVLLLKACSLLSLLFHVPTSNLFANGFSIHSLSSHKLDSTPCCCKSSTNSETIDADFDHFHPTQQQQQPVSQSRRNLIGAAGMGIVGGSKWLGLEKANANALAVDGTGPVAVIGASGRTGALCVTAVRTLFTWTLTWIEQFKTTQ